MRVLVHVHMQMHEHVQMNEHEHEHEHVHVHVHVHVHGICICMRLEPQALPAQPVVPTGQQAIGVGVIGSDGLGAAHQSFTTSEWRQARNALYGLKKQSGTQLPETAIVASPLVGSVGEQR